MVEVWSKKVRIFHSLLILSIVVAFVLEDKKEIHEIAGYTALLLVLFRIFYGLIAKNRYERLSSLFFPPSEIWAFVKSVMKFAEKRYLGHNPLAGLVMFAMLVTIATMAITGGVGYAMKEEEGILVLFVTPNFELGKEILGIHKILSQILLGLIGMHLMGVIVSSIQTKENYIRAIFGDGKKKEEK